MTEVEVSGSVRGFSKLEITAFVQKCLRALNRLGVLPGPVSDLSIAFVDDPTMRSLNRRFRRRNRTTDVLTFATDPMDAPPSGPAPLGEIVISVPQARVQARAERHSLPTEIRYLLLHGIIHALGFDHETDHGEMNALELRARHTIGLE